MNSGMEVAAYLCGKAASVTCIDLLDVPFSPILGPEVGKAIQKVCRILRTSILEYTNVSYI